MTAPDIIKQLVERFEQHRESYQAGKYNETQLRREFLDPFFEALGWDVFNKLGYSEDNKHVIHEDSLEIEGAKKAPDYAFKIGKERKFFVEAKKPSVKIETNPEVAFQLKRYVWSAKLPLGILTDFEEFTVYECRSKPKVSDSVKTGRVMLLSYSDYIEKWDEIVAIFSLDAVMTGRFDKFANSAAKKKGTAEVDSAFLAEIEGWRDVLARNIATRNKDRIHSEADLNYAVQMTIDRMIFLRICEDRGYESELQLQEISKRENIYNELKKLFERADKRYNSGLFHFKKETGRGQADTFTTGLEIDDKVLKDIIKDLYYPAPYVFALIPADILGQIYEQFLGKVIRLTAGGNAKVEEKPEVRKAGGVYYTPTFIVDTIVANTIGKLVIGKLGEMTPKEVAKLKIVDPACGSGTFLLGAYQYLLDWHLIWYIHNDPEKWSKGKNPAIIATLPQIRKRAEFGGGQGGGWKLTVEKKKEILLNNIHGVDIDPQAVEVTKLSLLLKVIEDPGQLSLLDERILPDLGKNIQCGNSLIGPDYWDGQLMVDEEERARVNAFDWKAAFPEVFDPHRPSDTSPKSAGEKASRQNSSADLGEDGRGFDAVIGNPPYILLQDELRDNAQLTYYRKKYKAASYKLDTYHLFIEQGIKLTRSGGRCAMITPANFLTNNYMVGLRRLILEKSSIDHILVIDGGVFEGVSVDNAIFVVVGGKHTDNDFQLITVKPVGQMLQPINTLTLSPKNILSGEYVLFTGDSEGEISNLWSKCLSQSTKLGDLADVNFGKQLRDRKKFTGDVITVAENQKLKAPYKQCYTGRDVNRYKLDWGNLACLDDGVARKGGCWDANAQDARNKLVCRQIGESPEFAIDLLGYQCLNTMFMVNLRDNQINVVYVLGILNSSLIRTLWLDRFYDKRRTFPKIKGTYLKELPIHPINFSDPAEEAQHDKMVSLVERMLALHKSLKSAHNPQEADRLTREVESVDKSIDGLVYELYGLTEDEIRIVEG